MLPFSPNCMANTKNMEDEHVHTYISRKNLIFKKPQTRLRIKSTGFSEEPKINTKTTR